MSGRVQKSSLQPITIRQLFGKWKSSVVTSVRGHFAHIVCMFPLCSWPILQLSNPASSVLATGHVGEPQIPSSSGQIESKGQVYHGSQHQGASLSGDLSNKKVVIIGTGNSGHDIAQDFCDQVTMVQRRPTYIIQAKIGLLMQHKGMYDQLPPTTIYRNTVFPFSSIFVTAGLPVEGLSNLTPILAKSAFYLR